jgi:hypothetical protein
MRLPHSRRSWVTPAAVSTGAALLALCFCLLVFPRLTRAVRANVDPDRFGELSGNILEGKGYVYANNGRWESAFDRGPVYPAVVAVLWKVTGDTSAVPVQVFQSVLHGLMCWFVFCLASLLYPRRISLVAQAVCALHPMLLWYTARIWVETTHTFVVALSSYYFLLLLRDPSLFRGTLTGFALGVASLTKSILLPFSLLGGCILAIRGGVRFRVAGIALAATTILLVLPWTLRNYSASGMIVPVHTSLGLNLTQGDAIAERWRSIPLSSVDLWEAGSAKTDSLLSGTGLSASEPAGDRLLIRAAVSYYADHPLFWMERAVVNALTFLYLSESPAKSIFLALVEFPLFGLALWGVQRGGRANPGTLMLAAIIVYFVLAHAFIVGWARYSVPIVPLLCVLGAGVLQDRRTAALPGGDPPAAAR